MDKEIQEMFRKKNEEIIKNNLQIDLERNINSLNDTLTNVFNNNFDFAIKNIISMYEDSYFEESSQNVSKLMNKLKINTYNVINAAIEDKKNKLIEKILNIKFTESDMEEYYNLITETTLEFKNVFKDEKINNLKEECIKEFNVYTKKVLSTFDIDITKNRINDYITYRLFGKIEEQIIMEFTLRDNNLLNKGKESYEKFQDISKKTTEM